jgi:hypothetical protein
VLNDLKDVAVGAAAAVAATSLALASATDRLTRTIPLAPGTPIRVEATVAELTIAGSNRTDVLVEVVRHAPSAADLSKYPALVEARSDRLHISAVQADEGRDPSLKTEITISAPADAVFQAVRIFEGRVKLTNLRSACDVDLRRGAIDATGLAGRVRLEVGIGSLDLQQPELTPGGMLRLRVFNGPLRVRFAHPPANARILAVTLNGAIASDIPLTMKDKFGPRFGEATLGTGEPVMSVDVVKGDIMIAVNAK